MVDANSFHHSDVLIVSEAIRASGRLSISYRQLNDVVRNPYVILQILCKSLGEILMSQRPCNLMSGRCIF
jgi:hypothetical protein